MFVSRHTMSQLTQYVHVHGAWDRFHKSLVKSPMGSPQPVRNITRHVTRHVTSHVMSHVTSHVKLPNTDLAQIPLTNEADSPPSL
jgi:hypothetical protein